MRIIVIGALLLGAFLTGGQPDSLAAINPVLSYQGSLSDSTGAAYPDGSYSLTFSIYADSVGGAALWTESQMRELKDGLVHAYLGAVTPFDPMIFAQAPLWLGIQLGGEPEFAPRHMIGSSVYSFLAMNSLALEGLSAAAFADTAGLRQAIASHESDTQAHRPLDLDASELVSGTIDPARLPAILVDSASIVDGTVTESDLKDASVGVAKLRANSVGTAQLQDSSVTDAKIADSTIAARHLKAGAVNSLSVENGSLREEDLEDSTITGLKIKAGTVTSAHLSIAAFTGDNIQDGTLTGADLADSTITGSKIAAASIESQHLSGVAVGSAQITDESIQGVDIKNGTISFNDIGPQQIAGYHIVDQGITGSKLANSSISGVQIIDESLTGAEIASNSIIERHVVDNNLGVAKLKDEPGLNYATGGNLTSVSTTITTWMQFTVNCPAPGYLICFMSGIVALSGNEIGQMSIVTMPGGFSHYGETRLSSPNGATGGNFTMTISEVIPVVSAGPITVYGNVRSTALSSGPVDFSQGTLQAIYIRTSY